MFRVALLFSALLPCTANAAGEYLFVTDPAMCAMGSMARDEAGMSFDGRDFWAIEYHCGLAEPVPMPAWTEPETHIRMGYCEEPGALFPTLFVFRWDRFERGVMHVYEGDGGMPTIYHDCGS